MAEFRSQPYRLKWPITPTQVEGTDEMFQILFKAIKRLNQEVADIDTSTSIPTVVTNIGQIVGQIDSHPSEEIGSAFNNIDFAFQGITTPPTGLFTQGSVIFAGPSGVLAQDNTNFFWDVVNHGLHIGPQGSIQIASLDIAKWGIQASSSIFSGTRDNFLDIGFNLNQEDPTQFTWNLQWESEFLGDLEWFLSSRSPAAVGRRPIQINLTKVTNTATLVLSGSVTIKSSDQSTTNFVFEDGGNFLVQSTGTIRTGNNNTQWIFQKGGSSSYYALPFINSANYTSIAIDGFPTVTGGLLGVGQSSPLAMLDVAGTVSPTFAGGAVIFATLVTPTTASDVYYMEVAPKITTPTGAATNVVQGMRFDIPVITLGSGATLTNAYSFYIAGAPTVGTTKRAMYVDGSLATSEIIGGLIVNGQFNSSGVDARFGGTLTLPNNTYLQGRNAANNANINIIKVNSGNELTITVNLNCVDIFMGNGQFIRETGAGGNNAAMIGMDGSNFLQVGGTATGVTRISIGNATTPLQILSPCFVGVAGLPTAVLHLKAGTATASTAPLKLTSGTVLTSPEVGAIEFHTDDFFATITTGAARKAFVFDDGTRLTSGKIPVATTNGRLIDSTGSLLVAGGIGSVVASTFEKSETGSDANVLTYTTGATDEGLVVYVATDVSALTGTSVVVTATWKDSNNSTATTNITLSGVGDGTINLPINAFTATNVVISTVFTGVSTAYKISATILRLK